MPVWEWGGDVRLLGGSLCLSGGESGFLDLISIQGFGFLLVLKLGRGEAVLLERCRIARILLSFVPSSVGVRRYFALLALLVSF
jgi:hypothetical protein